MQSIINITSASLSELKAFAANNNIEVTGDRRLKQSYIDAIEAHNEVKNDIKSLGKTASYNSKRPTVLDLSHLL